MGILLAFAPFIVFVAVERLAGQTRGLTAAAVVAAVLLLRDVFSRDKAVKVLDVGTILLFSSLTAYVLVTGTAFSVVGVRLRVDSGLLFIVLISLAIRKPFTLQYAREETSSDVWTTSQFIRTNYVISAVWAAAFLVMVVADLILLYNPNLPVRFGVFAAVLAIVAAVKFTAWYTDRIEADPTL